MTVQDQLIWEFQHGSALKRIANILLALTFVVTLAWAYAFELAPLYSYMGFYYVPPDANFYRVVVAVAVIPSLILPTTVRTPSAFINWLLYYTLYIPAITIPPLMGVLSPSNVSCLVFSVAVAYGIMCIPPSKKARTGEPPFTIDRDLFWAAFWMVYGALTLWVVVAFGGHMRIVGVDDVYAQRDESNAVLDGSLVGYATGILAGAFNPFLMSLGLTKRKYLLAGIGVCGQVLVYATAAMKSVVLSVVIIPFFYFILFHNKTLNPVRLGLFYVLTAVVLAVIFVIIGPWTNPTFQLIWAVVYMRTFGVPGTLLGSYSEYFISAAHPFTYWSHINVVRVFVRYPYPYGLGNMVGRHIIPGASDADANANFFATDGMAAMGFLGIVLSGIFFRVFLAAADSARLRRDLPLISIALIPGIISFTNASLFTTLVTGGVGCLLLLIYFYGLIRTEESQENGDPMSGQH